MARRRKGRPRKTGARAARRPPQDPVMAESPRSAPPTCRTGGAWASTRRPRGRVRARPHAAARRGDGAGGNRRRRLRPHVARLRGDAWTARAMLGLATGRLGLCRLPERRRPALSASATWQADLRRGDGGVGGVRPWRCAAGAWVVILDRQCAFVDLPTLKLGLTALADHYGLLTNHRKRRRNAQSPKYVAPTHSR